jgi:hypothetical protein
MAGVMPQVAPTAEAAVRRTCLGATRGGLTRKAGEQMRISKVSVLMGGLLVGLAPAAGFAQQVIEVREGTQQVDVRDTQQVDVRPGSERLARLEQAAERNEDVLAQERGIHPQLRREQAQIEDAIKRLKAGQNVTTDEIDQILGEESFVEAR